MHGNAQLFFVVIYCSLEFPEGLISITEIAIGISFSCSILDLLGNTQVFLVVLYCFMDVVKVFVSIAEKAVGTSFFFLVTDFL